MTTTTRTLLSRFGAFFQWRSLKTRVTLLTIVIFLIGIWSLAFYARYTLQNDLEKTLSEQQFSTVSIIAADINQELEDRIKILEMIAAKITPAILGNASTMQTFLESHVSFPRLFNYGGIVLRLDGVAIAEVPNHGRIGINYSDRDYMIEVLKGKPTISQTVMGKTSRSPFFSMLTPIRDTKGKIIGVLAGATDLSKPNFLAKITENKYGTTGGYLLVSPKIRTIVFATDKERTMEVLPAPGINPFIDRAVEGWEGSGIARTPLGAAMLTSVKGVPVSGWYVAALLPTEEAFAPVYALQQRLLLATLFLTLLASCLTWWVLKRQLEPISTTIKTLATLSDKDQHLQILPIARQDEIGELIGSFNRLLKTLGHREKALMVSEERYQSLFEQAGDGIFILDAKGKILSVNKAFANMHGYTTAEEMLPMVGLEKLDVEGAAAIPERIRRIMGGETLSFEVEHYHKNGHTFPLSVIANLVSQRNEQVIIAIHRDITDRKQAEKALQESEKQYRTLFEAIPDTVFLIDQETGGLLDVNPAAIRMYGFNHEEFLRMTTTDVSAEPEKTAKATSEPVPFIPMRYHRHKDGTVFPVELTASVFELKGRKTIIATARDITERMRAEEALHGSHRLLKSTFSSLMDAILILDSKAVVIDCNSAAANIFGYSREEMLGKTTEFLHVDHGSHEKFRQHLATEIAEKGFLSLSEFTMKQKDGTIFPTEHSVMPLEDDHSGKTGWVSVVRNITERKEANERIQFLSTLAEKISDSLIVTDTHFAIFYINKAAEQLYGYTLDEVRGKTPDFLNAEAMAGQMQQQLYETVSSGKIYKAESLNRRKDGSTFVCDYKVMPLKDEQDRIVSYVGVQRDITDRKQSEAEWEKLQAQLAQAQKMESVGRLAGGVAHDFNNMLAVILGHTETALEQVDPAQPIHADLTEILKAAGRSADLTRQLLAFARKQTVAPRVLDLNKTISGMLNMLQRLIGEDITLNWNPDADLWPVKMDPSQIDQILANLCVNARDAVSGVGKLSIETRNSALDEDYCATHAGFVPGEYVQLAISDSGCGMDKETLSHLYEPFFTTKETGKGTGLGLATVYGIVTQNNGFINVYSEPGQGTTFTIYLPRHIGKTEQRRTEGAPQSVGRGQETILLAEDEPALLELTTKLLKRQGYTVLAASTPGEAIRLAREHSGEINLLMTDVIMPEMNGRDLAKNLLALYPHMKRLFMSGYTADVIAHHGVLDEGVHFMQKPFSIKDLADKVREALDQK